MRQRHRVGCALAFAASACAQPQKPADSRPPLRQTDVPAPSGEKAATPAAPLAERMDTRDVRPPVAADLAEYATGLPGTGSKLLATIETTLGTLHCELYGDKAPITVANFIGLATGKKPWQDPRTGYVERGKPLFNGLGFHRVIPGFMIQGGDPLGDGTGGPGYEFDDEIWPGAQVGPGVLAMANAGTPLGHGTNGSQFFVMEGRRRDLDQRHTVFGSCAEMDIVKKITSVPRDKDNRPDSPVTITKITVTKGA